MSADKYEPRSDSDEELSSPYGRNETYKQTRKWTTLEKVLVILVILLVIGIVLLCVVVAVLAGQKEGRSQDSTIKFRKVSAETKLAVVQPAPPDVPVDNSVCVTPECTVVAARIYKSLDTNVHPCDNFYEFACNKWIKEHPIPGDQAFYGTFSTLIDEMEFRIRELLEAPSDQSELEAVTKAKNFYKSCVNTTQMEERGLDPIIVLQQLVGPIPFLNDTWDESTYNLVDLLVSVRRYGSTPIFYSGVGVDLKNSTLKKLQLDETYFMLPSRDYYLVLANESLPSLRKYLLDMSILAGASDNTTLEQDIDDILEFETKLAKVTTPPSERRDFEDLYEVMTIRDLSTNVTNKFDWLQYFTRIMNYPGVEINITESEPIIVNAPDYLRDVIDLVVATPPRVVVNYVMIQELTSFVPALPKRFRDVQATFDKEMYGIVDDRKRWKVCISVAEDNLGNAVGRLLVDNTFDEEAKTIAVDIVDNIRKSLIDLLSKADWMDEKTREAAIDKAYAIQEKIGYSDVHVKNDTVLNNEYKGLDYQAKTFFENVFTNVGKDVVHSLLSLRKETDKSKYVVSTKYLRFFVREWGTYPTVVSAFYSSTQNHIVFPAGILQPPFFSKLRPRSLNFGGIGTIIAHELTHGFDDTVHPYYPAGAGSHADKVSQTENDARLTHKPMNYPKIDGQLEILKGGRSFDKNGDLRDWWSEDVAKQFEEKAQCMIDQYSNYTVEEVNINLNGESTLSENIADNGGIRQAYEAYRAWVRKQGREEQKLPGIEYTHDQLLFISFAQVWCQGMRPKNAMNRILTGVHAPGRFRVIGSLQNYEEFSNVFNCPKTSYMNPEKKCRVW